MDASPEKLPTSKPNVVIMGKEGSLGGEGGVVGNVAHESGCTGTHFVYTYKQ